MQVSPKTIELTTPLVGRQQTVEVAVRNDGAAHLAFKVKTTAPKLYCVRPNCGSIAPGQSTTVAITYQGGETEPVAGAKCKDKFLFVGVETESSMDHKEVASRWGDLEAGTTPQQAKVRVSYKVVEEMSAIAEGEEPVAVAATPAAPAEPAPAAPAAPATPAAPVAVGTKTLAKESNMSFYIIIAILVAVFAAWRTL